MHVKRHKSPWKVWFDRCQRFRCVVEVRGSAGCPAEPFHDLHTQKPASTNQASNPPIGCSAIDRDATSNLLRADPSVHPAWCRSRSDTRHCRSSDWSKGQVINKSESFQPAYMAPHFTSSDSGLPGSRTAGTPETDTHHLRKLPCSNLNPTGSVKANSSEIWP